VDDPRLEQVPLVEQPEVDPADEGPVRHAEDDEVNRQIEEELAAPPILVADSLRSPHPLVAASIAEHRAWADEERRRKKDPNWHLRHYEPEPAVRANVAAHGIETPRARYLEEIRRVISGRGQVIQVGSELDHWMSWAGQVAHRLDPLSPTDPEPEPPAANH
jgi:hypothetical protein